ncbi:adhesive plaque matrix protein 2 [Calliphora vicina]|uniref:adhesive plaque matrix protein 2 n=1 Tax=Calliphora vicina TaxID=7373 RepID=UPI00325BD254
MQCIQGGGEKIRDCLNGASNNLKMLKEYFVIQLAVSALIMSDVAAYKRNYEAKYTKPNVPLWKQRACEKAQKYKANSHYVCDDKGDVNCLPGWQGDLCQVPMCRKGCDPMNGYCQRPGECRCRIGYTGELCDKCIPLPGCQHGDCTKPFECICRPGWDGLFCTEPTCRQGCHNTRGYCETPGECRCRIGWAGRNCSDCSVLPGCQHGTCSKPLECQCLPGYTGLLCQTPICNADCHKQRGYCKKPGECRCKVGWTGVKCDQCFPYPGCVNGDCEKPWECNCKPGWGGILCDEKLTYCKDHANICENGGKCISLTKEDGNYRCHCKQGYLGKNCEITDEFLLTSTPAPRITPPPLVNWEEEDDEDISEPLNDENEVQSTLKDKEKDKLQVKLTKNETIQFEKGLNGTDTVKQKTETFNLSLNETQGNATKLNVTKVLEKLESKEENLKNSSLTKKEFISLPTLADISGSDIIGTATAGMNKPTPADTKKTPNTAPLTTVSSTPSTPTVSATKTPSSTTSTSTTMSPLSKLDDDKNLHTMPFKSSESNKKPVEEDDDEECTDDNDDECEYEDEDEEDEDDEEDDEDAK